MKSPSTARRILIVTALKEELAAVRAALPDGAGSGFIFSRCGVGAASAGEFISNALSVTPDLAAICSCGFCGGLRDGLEVGDVVLPDRILRGNATRETVVTVPLDGALAALQAAGVRAQRAPLISAERAVFAAEAKRALGQARGAAAVDMESAAMADAAAGRVPVFALRVVSDAVDDSLPPEVGEFLSPSGNVRIARVTRFLLGGPAKIKTLLELKRRSDRACAALTAAWKAAAPALARDVLQLLPKG